MSRIAVDLTPILPGGENGGAKIMTIELLRQLAKLATDWEFILLTAANNHEELAFLDAANMRRLCVKQPNDKVIANDNVQVNSAKKILKKWLVQKLPLPIKNRLGYVYEKLRHKKFSSNNMLKNLSVDLLFCPFTAPLYFENNIPLVSVIYDLQHYYYPRFFTQEEDCYRRQFFRDVCHFASRIICISDYVKETIYKNSHKTLTPEQIVTIYIALSQRLPKPAAEGSIILERLALKSGGFILYPANFWAHKNHKMLLTAYSIYRAKESTSKLKLVCTGFPSPEMNHLQTAVKSMGLAESIIFPGYLSNEEFAVIIEACRAVIFPSLYEGFGMPILEAMAMSKPVLCSNVTSLPEIANDAALLFDPRNPEQIAAAIAQIARDDHLAADLVARGKRQVQQFSDSKKMAAQYLQIFRDVISKQTNSFVEQKTKKF